jgi:anti-sigma B factor antagonist
MANMPIHYEFRQEEPDVTVVSLTGQLNLGNRLMEFEHSLKQRIEEGSRKMVLDLCALTQIDSAGLGMVATCAGIMAKAGGRLILVSSGGKVNQMFELTHLNRVIGLFPSLEAALRSFSAPPEAR